MSNKIKNAAIKVQSHLQENEKFYIGVGIGVGAAIVVGATYVLVKGAGKYSQSVVVLGNRNYVKQTMEVYIEALGDPGNIIQDTTTGTIYASQNQAAKALGVNPARVSEHLSGKLDSVKGHTLNLLGKAPIPNS